jgi:hypothetical protein
MKHIDSYSIRVHYPHNPFTFTQSPQNKFSKNIKEDGKEVRERSQCQLPHFDKSHSCENSREFYIPLSNAVQSVGSWAFVSPVVYLIFNLHEYLANSRSRLQLP